MACPSTAPVHDGRDKGVALEIGMIGFLGVDSQLWLQALPARLGLLARLKSYAGWSRPRPVSPITTGIGGCMWLRLSGYATTTKRCLGLADEWKFL